MEVGRSIPRVDAADKVTGRAKYTDDLCPRPVLEAKILHSTIANGWVKSMDISAAQALPGVVKVLTCFDVPDIQYPTPGHPWSVEKAHQDVSDRKLLNRRVRIYGDDIAAVVAEDEITARQERAMRKPSPSTAASTSKAMGWRERVFWKVSSREISSFTQRPPT